MTGKWWRSPLFHFMLIGAGLFLLYALLNRKAPETDEIIIDDEQVRRSITIFQSEWGRAPTPDELAGLVQNLVRQEVYYRQALKMKLDHNDELIKRRMQQKLSFITHDLANLQEPSEDSLRAYYRRHITKYRRQQEVSYTQVYFNPDKRADPLADALKLREKISRNAIPESDMSRQGDEFSFLQKVEKADRRTLTDLMGASFADTVFRLAPGAWHGPLLSGYGVHLVFVHAIQMPAEPAWETVRGDVLRDYQYAASEQLNEKVYQGFRKQYRVNYLFRDSAIRKYKLEDKLAADEGH